MEFLLPNLQTCYENVSIQEIKHQLGASVIVLLLENVSYCDQ